jgi:hypothetical protein
MADDNSDGGGQWRRTVAANDDGMRDRAADYDGEGRERAANNDGIKNKDDVVFEGGYIMVQFTWRNRRLPSPTRINLEEP